MIEECMCICELRQTLLIHVIFSSGARCSLETEETITHKLKDSAIPEPGPLARRAKDANAGVQEAKADIKTEENGEGSAPTATPSKKCNTFEVLMSPKKQQSKFDPATQRSPTTIITKEQWDQKEPGTLIIPLSELGFVDDEPNDYTSYPGKACQPRRTSR
jgi:hypothetical protein